MPRTARVLTMGSCFADSIGSRLAAHKVDALVNPFGTVFQPLALGRLLRAAAGEDVDWQQHLVEARGRWQSYDLHGSIGADSPVELLQIIQELVRRTGEFLRSADVVLLTLGTAWAYRLRETGELVNNCHKQPADLFVRELLTPDEIINGLAETHAFLRRLNPEIRFVLTVSPVRHLKDTLPLNSVSKSVLRVATHFVSDLLPGVAYFPAYELLVDDLRDYRFYAADMLHPSAVAEEYVWDKFARTYFDAEFGRFRKDWAAVQQSLGHRPLHAGAPEHRHFLENTLHKLEEFSLRKVEVAAELMEVRTRLAALPLPKQAEPAAAAEDGEEQIASGNSPAAVDAPMIVPASEAVPAPTGGRPPRLSPEEFRAQRAARSGRPERGRGKRPRATETENEQFQAAGASVGNESAVLEDVELAAEPLASIEPVQSARPVAAPESAESAGDALDGETAKKKKRRSRGGAKRTARKNALRLAGSEVSPEAEASAAALVGMSGMAPAADEQLAPAPEDRKSTVIAKSVPVKRGGRGQEAGRVPRAELFAAPTTPTIEAVSPVSKATLAPVPAPAAALENVTPPAGAGAARTNSRNNRGRNNRGTGRPDVGPTTAAASAAQSGEVPPRANTGTAAEALSSKAEPATPALATRDRPEAQRPAAPAAVVSGVSGEASAPATTPAPAVPRKPNRSKRAVSGARPEKPAFDTPVVPVPDALQVRTQVAAGRMTGSSATLVELAAPLTKAASTKKAAVTTKVASNKSKGKTAGTPATATSAKEDAPLSRLAAVTKVKPAAKPTGTVAEPTAAPTPTATAKPKPAAKTKAAAAKPVVPKAAAKKPAAKAATPPTAKAVNSNPTGSELKPPKKPAKPA